MIPAPFDYARADSLAHAVDLLREGDDDAKLLAGGHSLIPLLRLRLARPSLLVDISRLEELQYVRDEGDELAIGAGTRHHDVAADGLVREHCPILARAAGLVGDPQVRHLGTIGGSVAHGDPVSDEPAVLVALEARFVVTGPGGATREVPAGAFFKGFFETDLGAGEVLTEIRVPKPAAGSGWSYRKFRRRAQDFAVVGVAAIVGPADGAPTASVALAGMGLTPIRAAAVEEALAEGSDAATAAQNAAEGTSPVSDSFASAEYRRHLAGVLTLRSLEEAMAGRS